MKDFKYIRKHRRRLKFGRTMARRFGWLTAALRWLGKKLSWMGKVMRWIGHKLRFLKVLKYLNPLRYIKRLDWYIIKKFVGYYFFSIALIITIAIVFDFNDNLSKFTEYHAPARAIIFDYYANFVPYFANLFSALFVFVAVIMFTSKLAGNSEIIAMLASGVSFKRLLRPYMITCIFLSALSYTLSAYVIPHGTVIRQNFETMYKNKKKNTSAENVQLQVDRGVIAYIQHYDNNSKRGYGFCLDKFQEKKLVSHLTASEIQYDTISDSKYHWKLTNWKVRRLHGMKEKITSGSGVRQLKKQINKCLRKVAYKMACDGKLEHSTIGMDEVKELLGNPPFNRDIYQGNDYAGVVTGLAWTSVGGEILFIETSLSRGKAGKLTLTGNLGDVMKESAVIALEYIKSHIDLLGVDYRIFENWNLHIHVPEGATPKDGPSAGITIATSIASAITQRKVRKNTAMTGEITLRGKVLPVGGIKEKILAAKRAGITDIVICKDNRKDIEEIPAKYLKGVSFHYVEDVADVWEFALTDEKVKHPIDFTIPENDKKN
jgi:hypothetical protein